MGLELLWLAHPARGACGKDDAAEPFSHGWASGDRARACRRWTVRTAWISATMLRATSPGESRGAPLAENVCP